MTSTAGNTALEKILAVLEYNDEEKSAVKREIGSLRRFKSITKEMLKEADGFTAGMIGEMMAMKEYYLLWSADVGESLEKQTRYESFAETFTAEQWDEFLMERYQDERKAEKKAEEEVKEKKEQSKNPSKADSLNVSWKVETKEIPVLPPNKTLKGEVFDEWHRNFYVKMCQAKIGDLLVKTYVPPKVEDEGY